MIIQQPLSFSCLLIALISAINTHAETLSGIEVDVSFVEPIEMQNSQDLSFGLISNAAPSGEQVILSADNSISGNAYISGANHAQIQFSADTSQTVDIHVSNISNDNASIFVLDRPTCSYNNEPEQMCGSSDLFSISPAVTEQSLNIGMRLTTGNTQQGNFQESFDVTATYQ